MSSTSLISVLERTVSPDKNELDAARQYLENALQANLPEFVKALSDVLQNPSNSQVARMAAGLQIKNTLTSKDNSLKEGYQQRWLLFPPDTRTYIKSNVLKALGTEASRPSSAAQCVAYIVVAELPAGEWADSINILCENVIHNASDELKREASLEAIGYICQDIDHTCLSYYSNSILTAIVHGMRKEEPNRYVRLAATTALLNSLEFTRANFDKETERNYIMEVVCESTQSTDMQIKVAALQCLVKIMSLYYAYMEPYMAQALFPITLEAMKSDNNEVALQGIEFWSNVCDEEVDLAIEGTEAAELGQPPQRTSRFYAKGALQFLVPILMQKLTEQEEFDDEDEWNPSKAAGVCLMLLASCCEEAIVPYVLPFVKDNIKNGDWRYRDAALMAFGSILGGLTPETIRPMVEQAMPTIIQLMYDKSVVVRDTAAWTIGRICEITPESAINLSSLNPLLEALVNGLKSEPRVAANVCWAFIGLSDASYEAAGGNKDGDQPETYCLSQYFPLLVNELLLATDRTDGASANLRSAAYEALMEMIKNSPRDCYETVQRMTLIVLERLNQVLQLEGQLQNTTERAQFHDLQGLLCATLQNVLRKVTPEDAPKISDQIMTALIQMFNTKSEKSGGVQEDALLAVSTLVEVLGEQFSKYMDAFKPFLFIGLGNHDEYQVCLSAVGVVGDICRALKSDILPYCDEIMTLLIQNLSDTTVYRTVKPQILSVFGDIALAIGSDFKKYLDVVLTLLVQASQAQIDRNDYDMIEYLNELREGILEAYTGIIQGLKGDNPNQLNPDVDLIEPHVPYITEMIKVIAKDSDLNDNAMCATAGLIGDLCTIFGVKILITLDVETTTEFLQQGRKSRVTKTKNISQWAYKELRKVTKQQATSWRNVENKKLQDDVDLDELLPQIGEFGRYQKLLIWFVCLPACIPCGFGAFNQLFMAHVPSDYWCKIPALSNFSAEQRRSIGIPMENNQTYSKCYQYAVNWTAMLEDYNEYFDTFEVNTSWPTEYCLYGWEYNTTEVKSSIVIDFDLVCKRDIYPTIGLAALNVGGPIGVFMFGVLSDRIGRKKSFFVCLITLIIGNAFTALSVNFWSWAVSRVIVGLTIPAVYQIPFIISLELVGPNYRSFVTVMTCLFYTFGLIILAIVAYFVRNWVHLAFCSSVPFTVYLICGWFLPESPRWLLAKRRLEEAFKILETLAEVNGKSMPPYVRQSFKRKMMVKQTSTEIRHYKKSPGVSDLCGTPNMRLKTTLITLNWFANDMVYVGLSYYGPSLGSNEYVSFLLSSVVEIPSCLVCWFIMDQWGRKWPLSLCMLLSGTSCIITVILSGDKVTLTLILFLFSKFTICASFLIIYPFAGELYPTQLRGIGIGFSAYVAGLGLILIPFITYLGRENLVLPLVIMGVISIFGGVVALRLPETLHEKLPQTIEDGEEFGKNWTIADCFACPKRIKLGGKIDTSEEIDNDDTLEMRPFAENEALRERRSKLIRQPTKVEIPVDEDGAFKLTYWM